MQDNAFDFTVRLDLSHMRDGAHTGLAMFERSASGIEITQTGSERRLGFFHLSDHEPGMEMTQNAIELRVHVEGDQASYSYSLDEGRSFRSLGETVPIHFSWWKGARPALFAYTTQAVSGAVDVDWVHYQPVGANPW